MPVTRGRLDKLEAAVAEQQGQDWCRFAWIRQQRPDESDESYAGFQAIVEFELRERTGWTGDVKLFGGGVPEMMAELPSPRFRKLAEDLERHGYSLEDRPTPPIKPDKALDELYEKIHALARKAHNEEAD